MKNLLKLFCKTFAFMLIPVLAFSQDVAEEVGMADIMRSNGKIYVVVAVLLIIFSGLAIFLISIDRKVRKLEKEKGK